MDDDAELNRLLALRRAAGSDPAHVEALIHQRFGTTLAVMFTDLVGFSRLVEVFGILHFLQLIHESESLFLPLVSRHGGDCLKRDGDSMLVVFDSAQEALATARAMVAVTQAINPDRAPQDRIEICIGLGWGEVLRVGRDVWGAEVNAASKLGEDMAGAGQILATANFRIQVPHKPFERHGLLFGSHPIYRWSGT